MSRCLFVLSWSTSVTFCRCGLRTSASTAASSGSSRLSWLVGCSTVVPGSPFLPPAPRSLAPLEQCYLVRPADLVHRSDASRKLSITGRRAAGRHTTGAPNDTSEGQRHIWRDCDGHGGDARPPHCHRWRHKDAAWMCRPGARPPTRLDARLHAARIPQRSHRCRLVESAGDLAHYPSDSTGIPRLAELIGLHANSVSTWMLPSQTALRLATSQHTSRNVRDNVLPSG